MGLSDNFSHAIFFFLFSPPHVAPLFSRDYFDVILDMFIFTFFFYNRLIFTCDISDVTCLFSHFFFFKHVDITCANIYHVHVRSHVWVHMQLLGDQLVWNTFTRFSHRPYVDIFKQWSWTDGSVCVKCCRSRFLSPAHKCFKVHFDFFALNPPDAFIRSDVKWYGPGV